MPAVTDRVRNYDHHATSPAKQRDPVCGLTVDPASVAATLVHVGKTYYFCSLRCHRPLRSGHSRRLRSLRALAMTEIELRLMARLATIGLSNVCVSG